MGRGFWELLPRKTNAERCLPYRLTLRANCGISPVESPSARTPHSDGSRDDPYNGSMPTCEVCHCQATEISKALRLCATCILKDSEAARSRVAEVHRRSRKPFGLPVGKAQEVVDSLSLTPYAVIGPGGIEPPTKGL